MVAKKKDKRCGAIVEKTGKRCKKMAKEGKHFCEVHAAGKGYINYYHR